jgi:hypothetical protein
MTCPIPNKVLSSPQTMLWQFYDLLRKLIHFGNQSTDPKEKRQFVALSIILSTTLVETFFNMFFRVMASEPQFAQYSNRIIADLASQVSLDYKVKEWPKLVLGKGIDFSKGIGQDFIGLKDTRNWLMHFTSTFESVHFDHVTIEGLADISKYEALDSQDAAFAISTAEGIIGEVLRLRGAQQDQIPFQLLHWLGRTPA